MGSKNHFSFDDWQTKVESSHATDPWTTVFERREDLSGDYATFSVLAPNQPERIAAVLSEKVWDVDFGFGHPEFWKGGDHDEIHYDRYGCSESSVPYEPLVISRWFHELRPKSLELSEEFRHYHNLYHDTPSQQFIHIKESGEEDIVAKFISDGGSHIVQIRTTYIRDYLAAKRMILARHHDHRRFSSDSLLEMFEGDYHSLEKRGDHFRWDITVVPNRRLSPDIAAFARFLGKDNLLPFSEPMHRSYRSLKREYDENCEQFIVGVDEHGQNIKASKGDVEPLTPVYFARQVLRRYYDQPSRYHVADGYIRCGSLWGVSFDVNASGVVHAWLVDLCSIPENEQRHWVLHNIPPEGGLSKVTIQRDLLAQFADSGDPATILKTKLALFNTACQQGLGWSLFRPLRSDDAHFLTALHVPTSEDQLEFDNQIISLAKVLPDSINQAELERFPGVSGQGSINVLASYLKAHLRISDADAGRIVQPLRDIQSLRSSSGAHRRGGTYDKVSVRLGLNQTTRAQYFSSLLISASHMLDELRAAIGI